MKELHCPSNIKVHFAGSEVQVLFYALNLLGVSYSLYTCFPWVERSVLKTKNFPIIPLPWQKEDTARLIPKNISDKSLHTIQDSGLFSLMFGAQKDSKKDSNLINRWYDGLVEFTINHGQPVTCVEVDCQKVLGVDAAWEFRERMRRDLPNNRIINVFHLEDGQKGLDRLIEFSDYIAISVPELRFAGKKNYAPKIARYIKGRKPSIDIHLLGCTEISLLNQCRFATSADSTTWQAPQRYGFIEGKNIHNLSRDKIIEVCGLDKYCKIKENLNETNSLCTIAAVENLKKKYNKACGPQDYYKVPSASVLPLSTGGLGNY